MKSFLRRTGLIALFFFVILVFYRTLHGEFLNLDDDLNITTNPILLSGDWLEFWKSPHWGLYIPVTYSAWTWMYDVFGANSFAFRSLNLLLHLANTFLVFSLFQKMKIKKEWALFGAAIFALHPMQIQAVAWMTGARDLWAAFFALITIHCSLSEKKWIRYYLSPVMFMLGLFSKPSIVALPLVLWCVQYFRSRKLVQTSLQFLPWFILCAVITVVTQKTQMVQMVMHVDGWTRITLMLQSYGFYIEKFFWPYHLSADYGLTPTAMWNQLLEGEVVQWLAMILSVAFVGLAAWKVTRPQFLKPALFFFGMLLPISGIVNFAYQDVSSVADHYQYLAIIGLIGVVVNVIQSSSLNIKFVRVVEVLVIISLIALTSLRVGVWTTNRALFESILEENSESFIAHTNLGFFNINDNNFEGARVHFEKAFQLKPYLLSAVANKYLVLVNLQKYDEVIAIDPQLDTPTFRDVAQGYSPAFSALLANVGIALIQKGFYERGFARTCEALKYNPTNVGAKGNLTLFRKGVPSLAKATCVYE